MKTTMRDWFEIYFWKIALYLLRTGYGYCDERDEEMFMTESRCGCCDASDVQDWIKNHLKLIKGV